MNSRGKHTDIVWNPWHGCHKKSAGCLNCYVYRTDAKYGKDSSKVEKTTQFHLPLKKTRQGDYKIQPNTTVYTCFTSDFFVEDADLWRGEAWKMIAERSDLHFLILTKRIDRFFVSLPADWGKGYPNVTIGSTVENQSMADFRLPILKKLPIAHKMMICEPILEAIDLSAYLDKSIELVMVGGESGTNARPCHYDWVLGIREQCLKAGVPFNFRQTGARFIKEGKEYRIPRKYQHVQARKAKIDWNGKKGDRSV